VNPQRAFALAIALAGIYLPKRNVN